MQFITVSFSKLLWFYLKWLCGLSHPSSASCECKVWAWKLFSPALFASFIVNSQRNKNNNPGAQVLNMGPERTPRPGQGLLHKWQVDPSKHFQPITVLLLLNFPNLHGRWSAIKVLLLLLLLLADDLVRDWAQPGEASEAQPTILRQQKSDLIKVSL